LKEIIILGGGGFARELFSWIKTSEKNQNLKFKGFLDLNGESLKSFGLDKYYLGSENNYIFNGESVLVAVSDNNIRELIISKLRNKNVCFCNYIHDSVIVGVDVKFGEGNIICPNSIFTANIKICDFNIFNLNVTIGHDVNIGSFNTFSSHCDVTGGVNIKNNNFMGSRVSILPKSKIGNSNKISAGSVIYKGLKDNSIFKGNPAKMIGVNK